jgi:hypothetical protein
VGLLFEQFVLTGNAMFGFDADFRTLMPEKFNKSAC